MNTKIGRDGVADSLKRLENNFDIGNPIGSKLNATQLGRELAQLGALDVPAFKAANARLTKIAERMISMSMGAVLGAVEREFHGAVSELATSNDVVRENNLAKKERAGQP